MVTLGLGALLRAAAPLAFAGVPATWLPVPSAPVDVLGIRMAPDKLVAVLVAAASILAVTWLFRRRRTRRALRAIADDQQAAMAVGIDLDRHFTITWSVLGVLSVLGGTLWTVVAGGGFGLVLVGLKIFPIVIIGGLDSVPGAIVGAIFIGVLE